MGKLLLIVIMAGAAANSLASAHRQPPLLIDASQSNPAPSAPLDAAN
jgi:hypothetical protein